MDTRGAGRDNPGVIRQRPWLLPLLLAVMVLGGWYFGFRAKKNDRELPVYVTGGARMAAGEEIYRRVDRGPDLPADAKAFTYPPFAAVPFVPMAWLPEAWRAPVWFEVNFVILVGLGCWLHRWSRRPWPGAGPPRSRWFWLLLLLLGVHHVLSVLSTQSHDLLIAALVGLGAAAWCRNRSSAGFWLGIGAAIKATPLLFLLLFGVRRRWLAVCLLLVVAGGLSLVPDWLFPRRDGMWWLKAWYELTLGQFSPGGTAEAEGLWSSYSYLNQNLAGTLNRLLTRTPNPEANFVDVTVSLANLSAWTSLQIARGAQLLVLGLIAWAIHRSRRAVQNAGAGAAELHRSLALGEVAAIACGMLLLSPQSSKAHFCVWIFPAAYLADRLLRGRRDWLLWVLVGGALLLSCGGGKDLVGTTLGNKLLAYGIVTWCTVLLLLATCRSLATAAPAAAAPPSSA